MKTIKIGVSGKRKYATAKEDLRNNIIACIDGMLARNEATEFVGYTSLAIGADTVFAEVVKNHYKMPLAVFLPMPAADYRKLFKGDDIGVFDTFLGEAEKVIEVSGRQYENEETASVQYLEAGKKIVDACDEMVFVWDKLMPKGIGGTGHVMGYYMEKAGKLPVAYIEVKPAKAEQEHDVQWAKKAELHQKISGEFDKANAAARENKKLHRRSWERSILFSWLAVALFAVNISFREYIVEGAQIILSIIELALVIGVYRLVARAKKREFHSLYLTQRLHAEAIRLLKRSFHTGFNINMAKLQVADNMQIAESQKKGKAKIAELQKTIKAEMAALIEMVRPYTTVANKSALYTGYTIKTLIKNQLDYHQQRIKDIGNKHEQWENLNRAIAWLFITNLVSHLALSVLHYYHVIPHIPFMHEVTVMLTIIFPASYAAVEGVLYFNEWHRIKEHSTEAVKELEKIMNEMPGLAAMEKNPDIALLHQSAALHNTAAVMLYENQSWHLVFEDKDKYKQMS